MLFSTLDLGADPERQIRAACYQRRLGYAVFRFGTELRAVRRNCRKRSAIREKSYLRHVFALISLFPDRAAGV